ncbi:MAG TPA: hypothetical protein VH518_05135 [Tepidisphaeraceae bacterium]|jgi:hypothetical protein
MPSIYRAAGRVFAAGLVLACFSGQAFAVLNASATISTPQTSAPFNYTITLHNTGDTNIGTFWFAWTATPASYDFLPTSPTNIGMPAGWIAPISHSLFPGDGYGIEYYNVSGSPISAGGSQTFTFTSNETPATINGPAFFPGNNVSTSFVYIGFPQSDAGFKFNVQVVPEPTCVMLGSIGGLIGFAMRRRR